MQIILRLYISDKIQPDDLLEITLKKIDINDWTIIKKSIDARNKDKVIIEYQLDLHNKDGIKLLNIEIDKKKKLGIQSIKFIEKEKNIFNIDSYIKNFQNKNDFQEKVKRENQLSNTEDKIIENKIKAKNKPVIIGFGPSSIFATFAFLENKISPIIVEMGEKVEDRSKAIENFVKNKRFNPFSNINFGEGGAGTYSDGKLYTRSRDEINQKVFSIFHYFGSPKSILYDSHPHIGSDNLIKVVSNIRDFFIKNGVEFYFNTKLIDIEENKNNLNEGKWKLKLDKTSIESNIFEITTDIVILATGHSCKDIYKILYKLGTELEAKPFALGFRVEHPSDLINKNQYGRFHKVLPSANYSLLYKGRASSIFSFCMCPGGVVLPSNSDEDEIVTNGASRYLRDGENSNSAIVASFSNNQAQQYIKNLNNINEISFYKDSNDNFLKRFLSFVNIKKSIKFEVGLVSKNQIFLNFDYDKIYLEISNVKDEGNDYKIDSYKKYYHQKESSENKNKIYCLDWEVNLIVQQIFEKLPFYIADEKFLAPFQNISDFFNDSNLKQNKTSKLKIKTTYPFGTYKANILKLFEPEIEKDFMDAFLYFNNIIKGYIDEGIAIGYETRTSSPIKVLRKEDGQVLDGIYMIGEGSGYCGGITTSAVDGYKIAGNLAKKLI